MKSQKVIDFFKVLKDIEGMKPSFEYVDDSDDGEIWVLNLQTRGEIEQSTFDRLRENLGLFGFTFSRIVSYVPEDVEVFEYAETDLEFTADFTQKELEVLGWR